MNQPVPIDRRCNGHARQRGNLPCKHWAILGSTVCYFHGGRAPQTIRAAQRRLALARYPALAALVAEVKAAIKPNSSPGQLARAERAIRILCAADSPKTPRPVRSGENEG